MPQHELGLIEAAFSKPPPVKRHGYQKVDLAWLPMPV
jgi:hypothetical protein